MEGGEEREESFLGGDCRNCNLFARRRLQKLQPDRETLEIFSTGMARRLLLAAGMQGDYRDPLVVPLSATAVTSELAGIFVRTLKLPAKILEPVSTGGGAERKAVTP